MKATPTPREAADYERLFELGTRDQWGLEGSTGYAKFPRNQGVPQRIREQFPGARFIYVVRDPIDRIWSQYTHNLAHGRERRDLARAIEECPDYLNVSRYHLQLAQYLELFPRERILVLVFEELIADPGAVLARCAQFLEIDPEFPEAAVEQVHNSSSRKTVPAGLLAIGQRLPGFELLPWRIRAWLKKDCGRPLPGKSDTLTPALRERLADALSKDMEAFFQFFGSEIPQWKTFHLARERRMAVTR
jgi:hypothetical protein